MPDLRQHISVTIEGETATTTLVGSEDFIAGVKKGVSDMCSLINSRYQKPLATYGTIKGDEYD